jgi:hypothetical protein
MNYLVCNSVFDIYFSIKITGKEVYRTSTFILLMKSNPNKIFPLEETSIIFTL